MSNEYLIKEETLTNIANAIRSETGITTKIDPDDMDDAISNIVTLNEGTADATAVASDLLSGKTAYVNGSKITGSMTNQGTVSQSITPSTSAQSYTIPIGYHNGSGKVTISGDTNLVAGNIKSGISIFGVIGTMEPKVEKTTLSQTSYSSSQLTFSSDLKTLTVPWPTGVDPKDICEITISSTNDTSRSTYLASIQNPYLLKLVMAAYLGDTSGVASIQNCVCKYGGSFKYQNGGICSSNASSGSQFFDVSANSSGFSIILSGNATNFQEYSSLSGLVFTNKTLSCSISYWT